jgi:hypothetical protein
MAARYLPRRQLRTVRAGALLCVLIAVLLGWGCTTGGAFARRGDSWIGLHEKELLASWGDPDYEAPLAAGSRRISYRHEWVLLLPMKVAPEERSLLSIAGGAFSTIPFILWCENRFEIRRDGYVRTHNVVGNACSPL